MPTCWTNLLQDLSPNGILWKWKIFWLQLLAAGAGIAGDHTQSMSSFCFWLLLSQNTPTVKKKKKCSYNLELYLCLRQQQHLRCSYGKVLKAVTSVVWVWVPGIQTTLKLTFLKIVNGLSQNVENCRPEVIGLEKNTWAAEGRLEDSLEWAGLFLNSTCAVNPLCSWLFQKPWETFLASSRSYRIWP